MNNDEAYCEWSWFKLNVMSSNKFVIELLESNIFDIQQKKFIKSLYEKYRDTAKNKIKLGCKCSPLMGRPSKVKRIENFNEMVSYYKKGYVGIQTICNIFKISRSNFCHRLRNISEQQWIDNDIDYKQISKEQTKKIEDLYNNQASKYANLWADKLHSQKYREDMIQDCLTQLWDGTFRYFTAKDDEMITIPYKNFCNNICERILNEYIDMINQENKILKFSNYDSENGKRNFLEKYISEES